MMRCTGCGMTSDSPYYVAHAYLYCRGWFEHVSEQEKPIPWWVPLVLAVATVGSVVGFLFAANAGTTLAPGASPTATATTTPSATHTKGPTSPSKGPTSPSKGPSTPTKVSVLEIARPSPVNLEAQGGDLAFLPVPQGLTVNRSGCASDGHCWGVNVFWWPTLEIVMVPGEPYYKEIHERCHAHQARVIGRDLAPSEFDLHPWYEADEGQSFMAEVGDDPWPWHYSAVNGLEAFAWVCAFWYTDPQYLHQVSPAGYNWAMRNLP